MSVINNATRINKFHEILTGLFFIMASTSAIIGILLYDPILNHSTDLEYIKEHSGMISTGVIFELILCFSNIGTGIMLYPVLKQHHQSWSLGYVCFRLLEVVFILIGLLSLITLLTLINGDSTGSLTLNTNPYDISELMRTIHRWSFTLGPHFMLGINTLIYSIVFKQSRFLPKPLSVYGIISAILILIAAIFEIYNIFGTFSVQTAILALPIAVF